MTKCVFLDRDGTIIHDKGYIGKIKDIKLVAGAPAAIKKLNNNGFLVIVVSNQSGVARGFFDEDAVSAVNAEIYYRLNKQGAHIDAFYWCPHFPEGKVKKYAKRCVCRKPEIGMLLHAKKDFNIDLKKSYMVGDKTDDIKTGKNARCKTILVLTGYGKKSRLSGEVKPDFLVKSVKEAVDKILNK